MNEDSFTSHDSVLIIDDDRVDRLMVREYIGAKFDLLEAKDGTEAQECLQKADVVCVLLDYHIPGTDSLELLSQCVKKQLPVVMLTGEGNEDVAVTAMKRGAMDYIKKKNLNEEMLLRTLNSSIQTVTLKRQLAGKQKELFDANLALHDKVEELERLNGDLENFIHIAAHDFREPLKTMYNYSDLLERTLNLPGDSDSRAYLDTIRSSVKRLAALIDDLRALTKIGYGKSEKGLYSLTEIIHSVISDYDPQVLKGVNFKYDILPQVLIYKPLVIELYRNLIDNAIKYGDPQKLIIRFTGTRTGSKWILGVRNNGSSVSETDLQKLFQPFFRGPYEVSREGSGLGLSLCKKIVERHGGMIWIESLPDGEIEFLFTLSKEPYEGKN